MTDGPDAPDGRDGADALDAAAAALTTTRRPSRSFATPWARSPTRWR